MKRSKRYLNMVQAVDTAKAYSIAEAVDILKANKEKPKFDETVEVSIVLNIDPKKTDQMVRGAVVLPYGLGKKIKIAVVCSGESEKQAREAGADIVGGKDLIDKIAGGFLDFDSLIATPDMMKDLSRLGKLLGPRGLMPSPKAGTVTQDVVKAINEARAGKVEFKTDKQGCVNAPVGKLSFPKEALEENIRYFLSSVEAIKPSTVKGHFFKAVYVASTMGVGLKLVW